MRRPSLALSLLLVASCGAGSESLGRTESSDEVEITALAVVDLSCAEDQIRLRITGEGDSSTGETVPIYRAYGCDSGATYHCDRDGCQRDGAVWRCGESWARPTRSGEGLQRPEDEGRYRFDDHDCDSTAIRTSSE